MGKKKTIIDINKLAAIIVSEATKDVQGEEPRQSKPEKNPAAVALGRLGGLKGGRARAESNPLKNTKK